MNRLVIFDLDGTLIDSKKDIAEAVNALRRDRGMPDLSLETIGSYVGDGAPTLIRRALGPEATEPDLEEALAFFIKYYSDHRTDHTTVYPGTQETLEALSDGATLAVLTNKPIRITRAILEDLGLLRYFSQVYGGNSFPAKKPDPIGILTLCREFDAGPEQTVMVGDSGVDVRTARNAGVYCVGVTFGFQPETLDAYPPDARIDEMSALPSTLDALWMPTARSSKS